jgi:hypothetical protein
MPYIDAAYLLSTPPGSARRSRTASGLEAICVFERVLFWLQVSTDPQTSSASFVRKSTPPSPPSLDAVLSLVKSGDDCVRALDAWSRSSSEGPPGDASWVLQQWSQNLEHFSVQEDAFIATQPWTSTELDLVRMRLSVVRGLSVASDRVMVDALLEYASDAVEYEVLRSVIDRRWVSAALLCPLLADDSSVLERCFPGIRRSPLDSFASSAELAPWHDELECAIRELRTAPRSPR